MSQRFTPEQWFRIQKESRIDQTYHSCAMSGNTLSREQVARVIEASDAGISMEQLLGGFHVSL